ncbi:MAG: hypothetical protein IPO32_17725 [Crocinitomicaceae bacterium]|nr:hypothetical protein [Crocinitomicaceae bacterium]
MKKIKVVHLSTFGSNSGAGIGMIRLNEALRRSGIDSSFISLYDQAGKLTKPLRKYWLIKKSQTLMGRALIQVEDKSIHFSSGNFGTSLVSIEDQLSESDFIHIHWVQNNFISFNNIQWLLRKFGKKIIFNLHDSWFFTGGCHITLECKQYVSICSNCPRVSEKNEVKLKDCTF